MSTVIESRDHSFLYKRIQGILRGLEMDDALTITTNEASALTDHELLEQLVSIHTHHTFRDQKLVKRLEQKRQGRKAFMIFLGRFGGCEKQTKYAQLSGHTRQNIHNQIKKGMLIAINEGSVPVIPVFQLDGSSGGEINGLTAVNQVLTSLGLSSAMKCTFWLNEHPGLDGLSPREYLLRSHSGNLSSEKDTHEALDCVLSLAHRVGRQGS